MQESIYNLLSQFQKKTRTGVSYKSKYPYNIAPTASTFKLRTSSYPNVCNLSGDYTLPRGAHRLEQEYATFGLPEGSYAVDPKNFHKKGETFKILPPLEKLKCQTEVKKPPIPTLNDQPISGLRTEKNYVISNAVDNILMQPKKSETSLLKNGSINISGEFPIISKNIARSMIRKFSGLKKQKENIRKKKMLNKDCSLMKK